MVSRYTKYGTALDREQFDRMMSEYYELEGWDRVVSRPRRGSFSSAFQTLPTGSRREAWFLSTPNRPDVPDDTIRILMDDPRVMR